MKDYVVNLCASIERSVLGQLVLFGVLCVPGVATDDWRMVGASVSGFVVGLVLSIGKCVRMIDGAIADIENDVS